jgi:hypothetical protein
VEVRDVTARRAHRLAWATRAVDAIGNAIGNAIAIPKAVHQQYSPTYGQTPGQAATDADGLQGAARRDTAAVKKGIKGEDCKKKYATWARKINKLSNASYPDAKEGDCRKQMKNPLTGERR